jgi:SSS family solute:Na+ symporter
VLWLVPIAYLLAIVAVGAAHRRWGSDEAGFFLARRSGGRWLVTGSLLATIYGAFGVLGVSGLASRMGLCAGWYLWAGAFGLAALGLWGAGRLDLDGVYSLPEAMGRAYGSAVRQIAAALIVVSWISLIAAQLIAAGKIVHFLATFSGGPAPGRLGVEAFIAVVGLACVAYTCLGGQRSVLRTDLVQFAVIVAALAAMLAAAGRPLRPALARLDPDLLRFPFGATMPPSGWLAALLTFGAPFLVGPDIYSRLLSGKGRRTARASLLGAALLMIPVTLAVVVCGILARAWVPNLPDDRDVALFELARWLHSPPLAGLLAAGLLAAVMSSADTCLLTVSTLVSRDLLDQWGLRPSGEGAVVRRARIVVAATGVVALAVALYKQDIVGALMNCYRIYSPSVLCPFLAMLIFPGRRFPPATGAAAILLGACCATAGLALGSAGLQLLAFALSAAPIASECALGRTRTP